VDVQKRACCRNKNNSLLAPRRGLAALEKKTPEHPDITRPDGNQSLRWGADFCIFRLLPACAVVALLELQCENRVGAPGPRRWVVLISVVGAPAWKFTPSGSHITAS
jgi:hypothetical protein